MIIIDFQQEFEKLKEFYSCAKCHTQLKIPIVLKSCRHIFCTRCLVIQRKQPCPQCGVLYSALDIDRGNKFVTSVIHAINKIEQTSCNQDLSKKYRLEYGHDEQIKMSELLQEISKICTSSAGGSTVLNTSTTDLIDSETNRKSLQTIKTITKGIRGKRKSFQISNVAKKLKSLPTTASCFKATDTISCIEATNSEKFCSSVSEEIVFDSDFQNVKLCKEPLKRNPKGETPLHLACKKKLSELVKQLIEEGMDINCVDWANWTPLHEAIQSEDVTSAQLLLEAGCLVNIPAANYATPLHQAAIKQNTALITLLLKHGADPNVKDMSGKTPNDLLETPLQQEQQNIENCAKSLIYNCDASKSGPRIPNLTQSNLLRAFTVSNSMEHLIVEGDQLNNLFVPEVMAALLKGVPIIQRKDVECFVGSVKLDFLHLIPGLLQTAFKKSLTNRLNRLPRLLDGMNIHLPMNILKYKVRDFFFTKDSLQALIEIAGGTVLKRAPSESTVEGTSSFPYHCQVIERLRNCAHYIIYDGNAPQLLLYNMKELRHVSAQWLLECIWQFQLT